MSDHGGVSEAQQTIPPATSASAPPPKKRHGRETATDMLRSLGLVLLIIVPMWWLAQSPEAEAPIRPVDPTVEVMSFARAVPGAPVPGTLPATWVPNAARYTPVDNRLRIGYVVEPGSGARYAEYNAAGPGSGRFVEDLTDGRKPEGEADVNGQPWSLYRDPDGRPTLSRQVGPATVVVGGPRSTASLDELRLLAASLVPARR